jgi:hypothetical protein
MADYYWYDKYAVSYSYKLEVGSGEQAIDSKYLIPNDVAFTEYGDFGGGQSFQQFYEDYDIEPYATYGDYQSYEFVLKNPISWGDAQTSGIKVYVQDGLYNIDGNYIVLALQSGYATYAYNLRAYWTISGEHKIVPGLFEGGLSDSDYVDRVYRVGVKGDLLETDLIKPNTYPSNGIKNGFWWIRKEPYTYPPPILINPKNAYILRLDEGDEVPYFIFKIQERFPGADNNLYHVRMRLSHNSDFKQTTAVFESRTNPGLFEYSTNGDLWQAFPAEGVPALSWIRIKPDPEIFDFGFYYWSAIVYGSQWGFGRPAQPRILVVVTDSDDVYFLTINGKRYYAKDMSVKQSSNGEISNLTFTLLNNNI